MAGGIDVLVEELCGDLSAVHAPRGSALNARSWQTEAPLRMLLNNLDPEVAEHPEKLVVYGGSGRAARSHEALRAIVRALLELADDQTLLVQSGKPVAVFRTHPAAPRVLIANALIVPRWATPEEFRRLEGLGLTMYGQMTAGSWIYIGTQGILQGTYQTFAAAGEKHFGSPDLSGRTILTAGLGGMGGAQPLAATMCGAAILCVEVDPSRIERRLETRYLDERAGSLDDGLRRVRDAAAERRPLSVGVVGNAALVYPELVRRGELFDLVTDQTAAHDPLTGYIPSEIPFEEAARFRERDPDEYLRLARMAIASHVEAMLEFVRLGCYVFDYGNNLRGEAREAGVEDAFTYPGFVPAYIRPLFCRGIGPFRWAALSGDPRDIAVIDQALSRAVSGGSTPSAVARAGVGPGRLPGPARPDLLARLRGSREGWARDERARPGGRGERSRSDRPRSSRRGLGGVAVSGDGGDGRWLGRHCRLADPERARQHGGRRDLGVGSPRRRRRDRELDPCGDGRRGGRNRRGGRPTRACPHLRSGAGRDQARRCRLSRRRGCGGGARTRGALRELMAPNRVNVVGIDLAWSDGGKGRTGLCVSRGSSVLDSTVVQTDEEIVRWLATFLDDEPWVIAVDAPLVVANAGGRRRCEADLTRVFGQYHAGAHSSNTQQQAFKNGSRGTVLAGRLNAEISISSPPRGGRRMIEVYPHPALVTLFGLKLTLKYKAKKGRTLEMRKCEFAVLLRLLESLQGANPPFDVLACARWAPLVAEIQTAPTGAALDRLEDEVDAYLCAYVGLFHATHEPPASWVFGDLERGFIVTPLASASDPFELHEAATRVVDQKLFQAPNPRGADAG